MSKPLNDKNKKNINNIELIKNNENYKNITAKLNYFIDYEIIDVFKNILNVPKIDFLSSIMLKVQNYLTLEYNQKTFDEEMFKSLLKHSKERLEKKYDIHMQNLSSTWENYQFLVKSKNKKEEIESNYLTNFLYHCSEPNKYAIHNCEKNEKIFGKFIKVIDKSNNKNLVKYVICENCRKSYFIEHFQNYCENCQVSYYSCEMSEEKKDLIPATLKSPHCEPVINEKMHCQFCKNILYLNIKKKQVKCTNCRFVSNPINMEWKCNICEKIFKSDIIAYNKSEVNYIKKVINHGLLLKKLARPVKLPCCKNLDIKTTCFYHKKDCNGVIYFAEFHKKLIIICEKCKAVNNFGKFIWTCPGCSLRFKDMKWKENEPRLRKEIFNKKDIKINNDLNRNEFFENRKNIRNSEISDLEDTIEIRTRSKNKSNLYDILKKRTNFMQENNHTEINNNLTIQKVNKDNKEESTEGSDTKYNYNLFLESYPDNPLSELLKVKKNLQPLNNSNKKFKKKKNKESDKKEDDESTDRKNIKKRYIFEKLIRRQFVPSNNIKINNLNTEGNQQEKNSQENIQIKEDNKYKTENNEKEINDFEKALSNNVKLQFLSKLYNSQSNSDIKRVPMKNRVQRMNKVSLEESNSQNIIKNGYLSQYGEFYTDQKSVDKMLKNKFKVNLEEQNSSKIKKIKDIKNVKLNSVKEKDNNNQFILNNYKSEQNLNVKKYLFKAPNNDNNNKSNIINNKIIINNNNINNKKENNKINNKQQDNKNNINKNVVINNRKNINNKQEDNKYNINNKHQDNKNKIYNKQQDNKINININNKQQENKININNKQQENKINININNKQHDNQNNINNKPQDNKININNNIIININNNVINHRNNNNKPQDNKIKISNNYKRQENNNNDKNKNHEKDMKMNKKIYDNEYKINHKNIESNNKENKKQNKKNNNVELNNTRIKHAYKESYYRSSDRNIVIINDSKKNSKPNKNDKKIASNYNYNNYISNNKNINNKNNKNINNNKNDNNNFYINNNFNNTFYYSSSNINKINEDSYSSSSFKKMKNNNSNAKNNEEKSKYDINTFKNKKEKNIKIIKNEPKKEEEKEEDPPDDVVKVQNIDQMEKIPLNPNVFKNPLLYNNIQQRIKHLLFRGRLPIFNIDNYTIKKTLGEGTNGVIYQVMNNKTRKNYAIKKLIANTIAELDFYQKEFQICYENPHPYILNIYGVCARCFDSTTYVLYVLMALAKKDLEMEISDRIKTKKYFQEKELISMLKKLVQALYYLQKERNVAHRDIKPENILLFENDVLKLADFGEAKVNDGSKKKTIRGTEFYMSPLLYAGNLESKYDIQHNPFKSDVFSLGYCFIYASSLDYEIINEIRKISDQNKLRQILRKYLPKIYSSRYIELLLKMIVNDENQRVDFIGLQSIIQYY